VTADPVGSAPGRGAEVTSLGAPSGSTYPEAVDLVERDHELAVLRGAVDAACGGQGSGVALTGDAGTGKSVLLHAACGAADGFRVLRGSCDPLRTPRPLGPFRDIGGQVGVAQRLSGEDLPLARVCEDLYARLRARPRVLAIEDLHWVDAATVDVLRFLVRRIDSMPLALLITYRDHEIGPTHSARPLLGDLARSESVVTIPLAPLSLDGVRTLVAGTGLDPAGVHRLTGGNPYFVTEIAKEPDRPLPASVRDAVLARTSDIAPDDFEVLQLVATAPDRLDDRALPTLGVDLPTLRRLDATGLIHRAQGGLVFRHELARQAVESTIPPGGGHSLHLRLLDALERIEPREPAILTHHAVAARDVRRAAAYAKAAAAEATRAGSHSEAAAFYEIALEHLDDARPGEKADLLQRLSFEQYMTSRLPRAIDNVKATFPLWRHADEPAGLSTAHETCAVFEYYHARRREAVGHAQRAVEIALAGKAHQAVGAARATRGFLAYMQSDLDLASECSREAARIADGCRAEALALRSRVVQTLVRLGSGTAEARAELIEQIESARSHGWDELASTGYSQLASLDVEHRRLRAAEHVLEESLPFVEERDIPICHHWQTAVRSRLRFTEGRWQAALEDAEHVLDEEGMPLARLWPHLVSALVPLRTGAVTAAEDQLEEAWALAVRIDEPLRTLPVLAGLAERMWLSGVVDPRVTHDAVRELRRVDGIPGTEWAIGELATWLYRLGLLTERPAAVAEPYEVAFAGRHQDAAAWWQQIGDPFVAAMALGDSKDPPDSTRALELLDQIGAYATADRLRVQLRQHGVVHVPARARSATRANPGGLTNRQLDVARLVARGLTNGEIAARLYISPKTADHHVSALLAKLGLPSRRAVIVRGDELGLR
jgi:DNA-binding CsgD family transcriptional regulator/tetratricopeptide (TPR) repeat protein